MELIMVARLSTLLMLLVTLMLVMVLRLMAMLMLMVMLLIYNEERMTKMEQRLSCT